MERLIQSTIVTYIDGVMKTSEGFMLAPNTDPIPHPEQTSEMMGIVLRCLNPVADAGWSDGATIVTAGVPTYNPSAPWHSRPA